jgi:hypothetical protein
LPSARAGARTVDAARLFSPPGRVGVPEKPISETGVLAEGTLDRRQQVHAGVEPKGLRKVKSSDEMQNSADWSAQPGAVALAQHAELVSLL